MAALPVRHSPGILGPATNLETLPGFLSWRVIGFLPVIVGLWSIVALAGTLAGEAAKRQPGDASSRRRSTVVGSRPRRPSAFRSRSSSRWRSRLSSRGPRSRPRWRTLPGDDTTIGRPRQFGWITVMSLFAGGRRRRLADGSVRCIAAAGVGASPHRRVPGQRLRRPVPGFDVLRTLSTFDWTEGFRPLADQWNGSRRSARGRGPDVVLLVVGVVAFARRDVGSTIRIRGGGRAFLPRGLSGPTARSASEQLPVAVAGGLALGAFGFLVSPLGPVDHRPLDESPQFKELFDRFLPGVDCRPPVVSWRCTS